MQVTLLTNGDQISTGFFHLYLHCKNMIFVIQEKQLAPTLEVSCLGEVQQVPAPGAETVTTVLLHSLLSAAQEFTLPTAICHQRNLPS